VDTDTLVENLIDDGQKLLERLPQQGFQVTAAFWIRPAEDDAWRFYIASPVVEKEGLTQAYRRLHTLIRQLPQPFWIDPLEVKLIGETNPIAQGVLGIHRRAGAAQVSPIRWGGKKLGNLSIEGAYLYPLPTPVGN
jgi:hypothetical protein